MEFTTDYKPGPDFTNIEEEFEFRLRKVFNNGLDGFLIIDSKRQRFQAEGVRYGISRGWLTEGEFRESEQYSYYRFYLTDAGKRAFATPQVRELRNKFWDNLKVD